MSPSLLELRNLLVHRGDRVVLDLPSLDVGRGETLAIAGPNGAGKSTLLLVIARLLKPTRGELRFAGQRTEALNILEYRRRLALVMQEPLLLNRTVFENVALGLRFRRVRAEERARRVGEWLERLGIAHLADRRGSHLSGGEARRASLGRALVLQPELLLLDEPFSGLDAPTRARLMADLRAILAETGTTAIFITHHLEEALQLSSRLAVMLSGAIRQIGAPDAVLAAPADAEVAAFLGTRRAEPSLG
jgi:tungstate transport system ATP-binding protein